MGSLFRTCLGRGRITSAHNTNSRSRVETRRTLTAASRSSIPARLCHNGRDKATSQEPRLATLWETRGKRALLTVGRGQADPLTLHLVKVDGGVIIGHAQPKGRS